MLIHFPVDPVFSIEKWCKGWKLHETYQLHGLLMWDKRPKLRLTSSKFKILHSIIYPLERKERKSMREENASHVSLAYGLVWSVSTVFLAVWWSTTALSFCHCDWLLPLSAHKVSSENRSNYNSTRERVDFKGLYGKWRLHLMGSWYKLMQFTS